MFLYWYIQSLCVLSRNIWKSVCSKICKKYYKPHIIFLTTEEKPQPSGKKTVPFLMRSCSIQSLVLHSGNGHMQKPKSYLRLGGK